MSKPIKSSTKTIQGIAHPYLQEEYFYKKNCINIQGVPRTMKVIYYATAFILINPILDVKFQFYNHKGYLS